MRLNSDRALQVGRELYKSSGGDWSKVHALGQMRPDGVVDLTRRPKDQPAPPAPVADDARRG